MSISVIVPSQEQNPFISMEKSYERGGGLVVDRHFKATQHKAKKHYTTIMNPIFKRFLESEILSVTKNTVLMIFTI